MLSTDSLRAFVADPIFDNTDEIPNPDSTLSFSKFFSSSTNGSFCSVLPSSPVESNRLIDVVAAATPVNQITLAYLNLMRCPDKSQRKSVQIGSFGQEFKAKLEFQSKRPFVTFRALPSKSVLAIFYRTSPLSIPTNS